MTHKKIGRNDPCWCGSGIKYKNCHMHFDEKIQQIREQGHLVPDHSMIKTAEQIEGIRKSGNVNIAVLDRVAEEIHEGMSTEEIDQIVYETTTEAGALPAPLHFEGFPKSVCTSLNNEVCHGIPSEQVILHSGDIVNVDVSTNLGGYYSDSSRMFCIGEVDPEVKKLVEVTRECVRLGIDHVKPWTFLGDMADPIHRHAEEHGYSVVEEFGGHGCGLAFHEDPFVSHVGTPGTEMLLVPGMVFTIEPMVNMGSRRIFIDADNGWTVYTEDGLPSAQWEVQVLVTEDGCEVLTY